MQLFGHPEFDGHEEVRFICDRDSGLRAIVAVHDTTLGPAIGGCRMWAYASEAEALTDVLRLSKAMTFKAAMAGLAYGGGKSVILGDPRRDKSKALFRAFGRAVAAMAGRYWTGEDVGTSPADMDEAGSETRYVLGRAQGGSGDPSPFTAMGVLRGIEVAVRLVFGRETLDGLSVAIQGLGQVGSALAALLAERRVRLCVADIDGKRVQDAVRRFGAKAVAPEQIHAVSVDVFAPCALGAVLNDATVPQLRCRIVCGSANNQLAADRHGDMLHARGILYAPDYVVNAGGLINIVQELHPQGYSRERALQALAVIERRLLQVLERAQAENRPPHRVADAMAREIVAAARQRQAA